ncbi:RND multidrug efflux membrane fusion protein (plasmid) [Legionella adelaidensis]|uniref:RND multidrug efflux membrane fusion protein n=1 Tax=Legionella adelaidensis TaxID=45056 RepID=A0A0W0R5E0_9GAMM|nr:efflux RND transporter periplasmic adaptor subunit [Legionella adelaidensis]KTC66294.1 RND multidrug efflux membrane fusion protein [Legionella adelaidensis]VEH84890.1 RND multidrug efflux membrane fusion protein [Legionella adelaidensis]
MKRNNQQLKIIGIALLVFILVYAIYYYHNKNKKVALPPAIVSIQKPVTKEMAEYITQTGNTVAYNSVDLVGRVEGYLEKINFVDGSIVKKGDLLFVIEPEPYYQSLKEAEATLAAQKAELAYAKAEYARQQKMFKQNATSLNNVQIWLAKSQQSQAEVEKAEANLENAKITYSYTHVLAPFNGRVGRHLIDVGNLVGNGKATDLATIEQINPIYVYFNLNELDLLRVRKVAKEHGITAADINKIDVAVQMQNEKGFPHKGKLDFVNTGLNSSTGTMEFRGVLPNKDYALVPGLFVQVRIALGKPAPHLTIPDTAILYDQIGPYIYLLDQNNVVVLQRVTLGSVEQGMRAIISGLKANDKVIVGGLQNATPGKQVTPTMSSGASR